MARDWNVTFNYWGSPPSNTEQEKCGNAERAIRKAIAANTTLASKDINVFVQGSYANGTNVRQDSDVDVCVLYKEAFFSDYSLAQPGMSDAKLGFTDGQYLYSTFKDDVHAALQSYFGKVHATRGNKAIDIRENTYRVDADVVACFEHHLYEGDLANHWHRSGTQLFPDEGGRVVNWPKQNYDNGITKDANTAHRFKAVTRILKNLRFELIDEKITIAEKIPSFLIECLVYNVPNEELLMSSLNDAVRNALAHLWNHTRADATCSAWAEVNEVKFLFHFAQSWQRGDVNAFLQACWDYIGYV
jgi:hypothetical protein